MKYMGSKNRIAKYLLPIILKDRKEGQWYVEPFVGGSNMIDKVDGKRIGNDVNYYLIEFSKALQNGWLPPNDISEIEYEKIKNNKEKYDPCLVGYCGFQLSYGAMWFSSYRKDSEGKRNYANEAYNNVKKQAPKLNGILYLNKEYKNIDIPPNSIIYCDPPYKGTAKYKANKDKFDHNIFYDWCRAKAKRGHTVYISEYKMPDDFECVWSKDIVNGLNDRSATEKLFVYKG